MSTPSKTPPAFVLRHLEDVARSQGLQNYSIDYQAGSKSGDGFMSNMLAVRLVDQTDQAKSLSLICKLQLPNSEETAGSLDASILFDREVDMYNIVLPMMEKLQHDHGLTRDNDGGFFAYPKCFLAQRADNNESIVILEDLRSSGHVLWNKLEPIPFANVSLLMQQLGRYHALSFVLRDQHPQKFAQLEGFDDVLLELIETCASLRTTMLSSMDEAIGLLDGATTDLELLRSVRSIWLDLMRTRTSVDRIKRFGVLSHGDCHTNNMMFTANNVGTQFVYGKMLLSNI